MFFFKFPKHDVEATTTLQQHNNSVKMVFWQAYFSFNTIVPPCNQTLAAVHIAVLIKFQFCAAFNGYHLKYVLLSIQNSYFITKTCKQFFMSVFIVILFEHIIVHT